MYKFKTIYCSKKNKFINLRLCIQKLVPRYDKYLISEGEYVKNSSTFAVSVPINLSIKLGFVSVNVPRETYFVDALRILRGNAQW